MELYTQNARYARSQSGAFSLAVRIPSGDTDSAYSLQVHAKAFSEIDAQLTALTVSNPNGCAVVSISTTASAVASALAEVFVDAYSKVEKTVFHIQRFSGTLLPPWSINPLAIFIILTH